MAPRQLVLKELGDALAAVQAPDRLTRFGIDGVDGLRPAAGRAVRAGIFLQRPELVDLWDATVWIDSDFDVAAERALGRYIGEQRPHERATFVLRNTGLDEPELVRQPRPR